MHTIEEDMKLAERIAGEVHACNGDVFYVGGHVRDEFTGRKNKDIDLEVHGIDEETLKKILASAGSIKSYGKSFGIYSLKHYAVDIALPVDAQGKRDPNISIEEALSRRDFTMNAMAENVLTHEIIDPFHGREDIERHVIRAVSDAVFEKDPLRVYRLASFAARMEFTMDPHTESLASAAEVDDLARERVYAETSKALMNSAHPSVFFKALAEVGRMDPWFTEVKSLMNVPQSPEHHPEGNVFNHTMMVIDAAASVKDEAEHPLSFLFACLCHDFGKAVSTTLKDGKIIAYGHENTGVPIARAFLSRLTGDKELKKYAGNMVALHMRPNNLAASALKGQKVSMKATNDLFEEAMSPNDLILLSYCDQKGRVEEKQIQACQDWLKERLSVYHEACRNVLAGEDLIAMGFQPGSDFREAIEFSRKLALSMKSKESVIKLTGDFLKGKRRIMKSTGENHE